MAEPAKRMWIVEPIYTDEGMRFDRERAERIIGDLIGTLEQIGGSLRIVADRVKVGELPPERPNGQPTLLAETVGLVVQWQAYSPVGETSDTEHLMDQAQGPEPEPEPPGTTPEPEAEPDDDGFGLEAEDVEEAPA